MPQGVAREGLRPPAGRPADPCNTDKTILLIGFQHQGNLGLGYLASTLREHGYSVVTCDFEAEPAAIVATAARTEPIIIGFSLIFQFYIERFAALIRTLREIGRAHV